MRASNQANGVTVKAYAGTTGVLLAMNIEEAKRPGLLGFAIERVPHKPGNSSWLLSGLCFDGSGMKKPYFSNQAPIQKFRWSDYSVYPDIEYTYTVHPVYGKSKGKGLPPDLDVQEGPVIKVRTQRNDAGKHQIVFNRAVAASQAFASRFPKIELSTEKVGDPKNDAALEWLSRGLLEKILNFIGKPAAAKRRVSETEAKYNKARVEWKKAPENEKVKAQAKMGNAKAEWVKAKAEWKKVKNDVWALDIAIFEYELHKIIKAVEEAHENGVKVRIIFHAKPDSNKPQGPDVLDEQTKMNMDNLVGLPEGCRHARLTNGIFHDKFVVLSKVVNDDYQPQEVLCGSTNFTENGVYRQANVVHVIQDSDIAKEYLNIFNILWLSKSTADVKNVRSHINEHHKLAFDISKRKEMGEKVVAGFSPRSGVKKPKKPTDLEKFKEIIGSASQDVLFCTAFDLDDSIEAALAGEAHDHILRYGLQNAAGRIQGIHADCTASFVTAALLPEGLEGWLKETKAGQEGQTLIHTKMMIIDFTSDFPVVVSGSHNFSINASTGNDENYLIIFNNKDVADIYGCELMRFYDHYRFRYQMTLPPPASIDARAAANDIRTAVTSETLEKALKAADALLHAATQIKKDSELNVQDAVQEALDVAKAAQIAEDEVIKHLEAAIRAGTLEEVEKELNLAKKVVQDTPANSLPENVIEALKAAQDAASRAKKNGPKFDRAINAANLAVKTAKTAQGVQALETAAKDLEEAAKLVKKRLWLCPDDTWTEKYFSDPLKILDRLCFSGAKVNP